MFRRIRHLGYQSDEYTPTFRGFDSYTGYYSGAEEHFTHYKAGEGENFFDLANNSGTSVRPLYSMVGKTQNETEEFYSVYIYGNETVRLIKRHAALHASCECTDLMGTIACSLRNTLQQVGGRGERIHLGRLPSDYRMHR